MASQNSADANPFEILFVGGGHASIQVLKDLPQKLSSELKQQRVHITVINEYPFSVYSGMIPGVIARQYSVFDAMLSFSSSLKDLFPQSSFNFICGRVHSINPKDQTVLFSCTLAESCKIWQDMLTMQQLHKKQPKLAALNDEHLIVKNKQEEGVDQNANLKTVKYNLLCIDIGSTSGSAALVPGVLEHGLCCIFFYC